MRVLLAGDRPQDRDLGRRAALRSGLECAASDSVPLADLRLRLAREPAVHLVVVCVESDATSAAKAIQAAADQGQPVYAVVAAECAEAQEAAWAAGAVAVWTPDRMREELLNAAEELRRGGKTPDRRGRVIAVIAAQPGTGATTVATGMAFGLADKKSPALLAELGAGVPELALDLDLAPKHSLAELIQASDRMDAGMLRGTAVSHAAGVDVLAYPSETRVAEVLGAGVARDFQILMRSVYPWTIVDAGHPHAAGVSEMVLHSDSVVVVTRLDPPSLRLTRRYVQVLTAGGVADANIVVVANRYGQAGQVPWKKAEEALQVKVKAWLPDDSRSVNKALSDGKPITQVASRSSLAKELRKLAIELATRLAAASGK